VALVAIGVMSWRWKTSGAWVLSSGGNSVPTTRVVRGALELGVHTTGELRASRSVTLQAPPVGGGMLRLVTLLETGTAVKADDVVMEFDPTEQEYALEQAQSQVAEAEQQIVKLKADRDAQTAQDRVDLLTAQFDLRRAQLDAKVDQDLV